MFKNQKLGKAVYMSLGLLILQIATEIILIILKQMTNNIILGLTISKIVIIVLPQIFPNISQPKPSKQIQIKQSKITQLGLWLVKYLASSLSLKSKQMLKKEADIFFNYQNYLCKNDKNLKITKQLNMQKSNIKPRVY